MADKPLIMSGPMVRALLEGRKSQTRRMIRPQPLPQYKPSRFCRVGTCNRTGRAVWEAHNYSGPMNGVFPGAPGCVETHTYTPAVGDRLWVREAHMLVGGGDPGLPIYREGWREQAEQEGFGNIPAAEPKGWRSPIHMPRWASRLTLTVTDVRVERLGDISEADAEAEGVYARQTANGRLFEWNDGQSGWRDPRDAYNWLWNSLHGPDAWSKNPWVAAISFTTERRNIDAMPPPVSTNAAAIGSAA